MNSGKDLLIDEGTRIKALLDVKQEEVIQTLAALNGNFKKLRNPFLRKLLAGRVTIADACKIAGCPVPDFMASMREIGFRTAEGGFSAPNREDEIPLPIEGDEILEFDVRPILNQNGDPLKEITARAMALKSAQCLRLIAPFVPVPLITLLGKKGFIHSTCTIGPDEVHTYFKRGEESVEIEPVSSADGEIHDFDEVMATIDPEDLRYIDVRHLEMPQPMLTILENLDTMEEGEALYVYHKKVPVFFLPQLQERGYKYHLKQTPDGKVNMLIYRI